MGGETLVRLGRPTKMHYHDKTCRSIPMRNGRSIDCHGEGTLHWDFLTGKASWSILMLLGACAEGAMEGEREPC